MSNDKQIGGNHYTILKVQPWEAMEAWSTPEEFAAHLKLTAIKYLARAGTKGPARDDIAKAHHYLEKLLQVIDSGTL